MGKKEIKQIEHLYTNKQTITGLWVAFRKLAMQITAKRKKKTKLKNLPQFKDKLTLSFCFRFFVVSIVSLLINL